MSATVVDPLFYYQQMRPEAQEKHPDVQSAQQQRSGNYVNVAPQEIRNWQTGYSRSPKAPRHLTAIVRPVYDDRLPGNGGKQRFPDAEIIANPLTKRHYYRSVSSLDVSMEEDDTPRPTILKEFGGSASSIDIGKTVGSNIRLILDQLRHGKSVTVNGSANSLSSLQNSDGSGSGVLCNPKSKGKGDKVKKSSLRSRPSIFRKMRGSQSENDHIQVDAESLSGELADGERIRRKIFAHYDTMSLLTKLTPSKETQTLSSRRNTTTGASAANYSTRCVLPSAEGSSDSIPGEDVDQGDGKSNHLLLNCPYFRNEICPEDCSPSISPASNYGVIRRRPQGRRANLPSFRPHQGTIVLDEDTPNQKGGCMQLMQPKFEHIDHGAAYYRKYFHGEEHSDYFGMDEKFGPIALSIKREKTGDPAHKNMYRLIVRTSELPVLRGCVLEDSFPRIGKDHIKAKDIVECIVPEVQTSCLRLGTNDLKTEEQLLKLDEQAVPSHYKVGIMYCKAGQCTEEEMYNNEHAGPAFDEFLDLLGQRVRLKSFSKYRAQLDNKSDSTGLHSLYATFCDYEIMFHVSTMLPYTPSNKQQLLRKRHIGNDIVTIVFQEPGALPFSPKTIRSHFQHVFIVVRVLNPNTDHTQYMVSISRSRDVPPFGPPLPESTTFNKDSDFVDFILTKVINAENAAHKSDKFVALATRTRQEYLKDLAQNHVTHSGIESGFGKLTMFSLSSKKKDRPVMSFLSDAVSRGALAWSIQAKDFAPVVPINARLTLGISTSFIVLMEPVSGAVMKIIPNSNIMGWRSQEESLTLYYHIGESMQIICDSAEDWREIIQRLKAVTAGTEVVDLTLSRNGHGQLGFRTEFNGVITEVDNHSHAWKVGLRKGCCLLEICGQAVSSLDHESMAELLRRASPVTIAMLPPLEGGLPRRGCDREICIKAPEHILSANYDNLSDSMESIQQPPTAMVYPVASRSTSSLVDGHVAFFLKSDGAAHATKFVPYPPAQTHAPKVYDRHVQPSLDDLEAESRWWMHQMAEETARLNRLNPQSPHSPSSGSPGRVPLQHIQTDSNGADLRPFRPFERKLSPNSAFPLFDSGTDTMSSTTSKSSSQSHKENQGKTAASTNPSHRSQVRHHKTDPGFRSAAEKMSQPPVSRVPLRNSPNKSSLKKMQHRHSVNLQEELLKLINPDLIDSDSLTVSPRTTDPVSPRRASESISYPGGQSVDSPSPPIPSSRSLEAVVSPEVPQRLEWNSLVTSAERAAMKVTGALYGLSSAEVTHISTDGKMDSVRNQSPPPLRPRSSSKKHCSRPVSGEFQPDRFVSAERIQELENRITKLIHDLNKEREDRMELETQVRQLKFDNHRLQKDDVPLSAAVPFTVFRPSHEGAEHRSTRSIGYETTQNFSDDSSVPF